MSELSFSARQGLKPNKPLVFEDAPASLRYGVREVLHELGYGTPTAQRTIICKAWRVPPDRSNWSDYPNVEDEVVSLLTSGLWNELFDRIERIPKFLKPYEIEDFYEKFNRLLAEESIGYYFQGDKVVPVGTEELDTVVEVARTALSSEKFAEPRRQFERGLEFRSTRPPDWANAIKEAVNSVEGVLQIIYNRPGVSLTTIVREELPADLPGNIKELFKSLYGQGSGTVGARHASIGGNEPNAARAELALHVAAALHGFAVGELDV